MYECIYSIREEKEAHKHTQGEFQKAQKFIMKLQDVIATVIIIICLYKLSILL